MKPFPIIISYETTRVTAPLRPDGFPDYFAAINEMTSQGVTPDNNALVMLWTAVGPGPVPAEICDEYFRRLGMFVPPEEGNYFQGFRDYATGGARQHGKTMSAEQIEEISWALVDKPWGAEDFPLAAEWLRESHEKLAILEEASRRPRWYEPVVPRGHEARPPLL